MNTDVENIDLYVNAADAMMLSALQQPEINKAADWMVNLTKSEIISASRGNQSNAFPSEMAAVSSLFSNEFHGFYSATYTNSGSINGFSAVPQMPYYAKISLWAKTTRNGFLYLDSDSLLSALLSDPPFNAIASTVRIGFVPVNYDVNGAAPGGMTEGEAFSYAVVWEPNSTSHLDPVYGGPGTTSKLITNAVKNAVPTSTPADMAALANAVAPQTTYDFLLNQTNINGSGFYNSNGQSITFSSSSKIALFNMNMDTMQQFNIYIWVEGADADTVDSVAKSSFRTYLKFGQEYDKYIGNTFIPKT